MYKGKDPREALQNQGFRKPPKVAPDAHLALFGPATGKGEGWKPEGWYVRGQNFLVHFVLPEVGAKFVSQSHLDEQVYLLTDPAIELEVTAQGATETVSGNGLLVLPPGDSTVTVIKTGKIQRLLTVESSPELAASAVNASDYDTLNEQVAPKVNWPDPVGGFKVRYYSLNVPDQPGRFGRIFRTTNFMVNVFAVQNGPRDKEKLSPHDHWDFEQCSIGIEGSFVHHLRWPWSPNRLEWRADQHLLTPSPSVLIIPPTVEHTTEAVGTGENSLVDVYCPPRVDFSNMDGWVLNAADYPAPAPTES
jgi:hypothetical protein